MRRVMFLITILLGLIGFVGLVDISYSIKVFAGEKETTGKEHEYEVIPTKALMKGLATRAQNLFGEIIKGDFKAVKEESTGVQEEGKKIEEYFFPVNPAIDAWLRRSTVLDPTIPEAIEKLKSHFGIYIRRLETSTDDIKTASDSKNAEAAFTAYMRMAKACFECHNKYSGNQ